MAPPCLLQRINLTVTQECAVVRYAPPRQKKEHRTSRIGPSRRQPLVPTGKRPAASSHPREPLQKSALWIELSRQRTLAACQLERVSDG